MDVEKLANQGVKKLKPYVPGKPIDELKKELHLTKITKLASNENPLDPTHKLSESWANLGADLARYPDGGAYALKKVLANFIGIDVEQITLGNGSEEVITMLFKAFVNPQDSIIVSKHSFIIYTILAQAVGAKIVDVDAYYANDLNAILSAIDENVKLICIANPNNPTGTRIVKQELLDFLNKVPENILVLLDEAYAEYNQDLNYLSGIDCLNDFKNLIVTRTFSKAYGLASLRCGYSVSSIEIAAVLNKVRPSFNVNAIAQASALLALEDQTYINKTVSFNEYQKQKFYQACEARNISSIESFCNFVTIELEQNATTVFDGLLKQGVIIRPLTGYNMPNHVRVSQGTDEEMQHFWDAFDTI